jgi:putative hydroxymethylpyrimidine transport system substrate-binding protein
MRQITISLTLILCLGALPAQAADKLTVLLDWFVNPDHATLIIAQEKGFFAQAGLEVELTAPANPNDPPKLVAARKADLAISYQPQLHLHVDRGLPLRRIATLVGTPLSSLVVLRDGPIKAIADLKGRKIGFSVGGFEDAILGAMLRKAGLSLEDVTLINVNFSLSPSLISGQVDAVIGAYRNFELNQMDIVKRPGRAFYVEEEGVPAYDELIVVAHADRLFLINHPAQGWDLFIKGHKDLNDELNRRAFRDTLPRFALRPAALDQGRYRRMAQFLKDQGLISAVRPVSDYAVELK